MSYSKNLNLNSLHQELQARIHRNSLISFAQAINPSFKAHNHTKLIATKIEQWIKGTLPSGKKNIMLFVPPQHGKSELFSRMAIPYLFGINPDCRVIFASYNDTFAKKFNRQIKRNIDNPTYRQIFPNTALFGKNVLTSAKGSFVRNAKEFEIVNHKGSLLVVGVGAGATGNPADFIFIDDYIKDAQQAYRDVFHEAAWEWYTNVLETRIHNNSRIGITFTRWSDKDIAARLLEIDKDNWEVLELPAIREDYSNSDDWREIGEALCPEWHSKEKILNLKTKNPMTFAALYQQRPTPKGGGEIKGDWFKRITIKEFLAKREAAFCPKVVYIDAAEGKKQDYTAVLVAYFLPSERMNYETKRTELVHQLYIRRVYRTNTHGIHEAPTWVKENIENHVAINEAVVKIEAKSAGASYIKDLRELFGMNATEHLFPKQSNLKGTTEKVVKIRSCINYLYAGNVFLIEEETNNEWIDEFLREAESFPKGKNDDQLDTLAMAIMDAMYDSITDTFNDFKKYF